jgi:putative copper export protein/methionine-rich copper-binding protein CopC
MPQIRFITAIGCQSRANLKWRLLVVGVVTGIMLALVSPAATVRAHAGYERSDPAANAHLPAGQPPQQVQVWFGETVEGHFSELSVVNSTNARVDTGASHVAASEPNALVVALRPGLPDGTYTVNYRSTSADDGHVTRGGFSFTVGTGTGASLPLRAAEEVASSAANLNFWVISLRWLNYLMAAILLGGFGFALLVWRPTAGSLAAVTGKEPANARMNEFEVAYGLGLRQIRRLAWVALGGLLLSWVGWVVYQTCTLSGQDLGQLAGLTPASTSGGGPKALLDFLFTTRYGIIWMARLGLMFFLFDALVLLLPDKTELTSKKTVAGTATTTQEPLEVEAASTRAAGQAQSATLLAAEPAGISLSRRKRQVRLYVRSTAERTKWWWSVSILSAGILLTHSLTSHAASQQSFNWLTIIVDWVHLLATSIWVGGLIALAAVLLVALPAVPPGTGDRTRLLAVLVPAFSRVALIAVATLVLTGTLNAVTQLTGPGQLFTTPYGQSLSVKIILLVMLLGLGAYNLLVAGKRIQTLAAKNSAFQKEADIKATNRLSLTFRRTVLLEIGLAALVLLAAAFLTSNPPPRSLNRPVGMAAPQVHEQAMELERDLVPIVVDFRQPPRAGS